jgi:predicted GIY-YIG superfamily endonuclease
VADTFFVYILRCSDRSLYVGHTADVATRLQTHNEGRRVSWTAARRPVMLLYQELCSSEVAAIQRERQIKRWTHAKKMALVNGDMSRLRSLAKRHR